MLRVLSYLPLAMLLGTYPSFLWAANHKIEVFDASGNPFPGAVVYLESEEAFAFREPADAVMDQIDKQFFPHILVVQRGTSVSFPNSDSIKHHVFSFSRAKKFEIRLYRGELADPVEFDAPGEVELGCNVHDWMLGYIFVVDTPFFSRTDENGVATIEAPDADYSVGIWHPQIQDDPRDLQTALDSDSPAVRVKLRKPLLPPYDTDDAVEFDDYD